MSMTARRLVDDIFSRVQANVPPDKRVITADQHKFVSDLMLKEPPATVRRGDGGALIWTPESGDGYVLAEDTRLGKHTLTRLRAAEGVGRLF